jgi:hypothetical protein
VSDKPNVGQSKTDVAIAVGMGTLSLLPYAGPILAEIVGAIIPNQRIDRIARFAKILDDKLAELDKEFLEQKMRTEEFVDLFEDGAFQAARAMTDERRERIASLLKNSLSSDDLEHVQEKQLLSILGQLNDAELLILRYYGLNKLDPQEAQRFFELHEGAIRGPQVFMGAPQEDVDRVAVHETYRDHLRRLGLVRATYKKRKKGEPPEWDLTTGMIKADGNRITPLGQLLLRYVDAEAADPPEPG